MIVLRTGVIIIVLSKLVKRTKPRRERKRICCFLPTEEGRINEARSPAVTLCSYAVITIMIISIIRILSIISSTTHNTEEITVI